MPDLILVKPTAADEAAIFEYRDEFAGTGELPHGSGDIEAMASFGDWLQKCQDEEDPGKVQPGRVPASQYLAVRESDGRIIGTLQIRHYLNDFLELRGGHIGYSVRPAERRKGYATEMLRLALDVCHDELGIEEVLLTCVPSNIGSARVMQANGGVYERQVTLDGGETYDHYRIPTSR